MNAKNILCFLTTLALVCGCEDQKMQGEKHHGIDVKVILKKKYLLFGEKHHGIDVEQKVRPLLNLLTFREKHHGIDVEQKGVLIGKETLSPEPKTIHSYLYFDTDENPNTTEVIITVRHYNDLNVMAKVRDLTVGKPYKIYTLVKKIGRETPYPHPGGSIEKVKE